MNTIPTVRPTPSCPGETTQSAERGNQIPSLSRNRWSRPDLARVMNTEFDYAPYITPPASPPRSTTNS